MNRSTALFLVALLAVVAAAAAQPITIGETVKLPSKVMGETRTIVISTPANYARSQERYPVLYMTDGEAHLTHTRGTVDFLVRNGLMPDLIIVGVGNTDRTRDLTPTHAFRTARDGTRQEVAHSGGAGRFLDFFAGELIPYVEGHYRTQPYRIFAGHSYGGLFALWAFFTRPEMFNATIAASPSLDWDDDLLLRTALRFFKEHQELPRTLYVTMANEEDGTQSPTRLERLTALFEATKPAGFRWGAKHMPEETHGTVVLRSHYWGLRTVFEGWTMPALLERGNTVITLADVDRHYAGLSARLGLTVRPGELLINQLGYRLLNQGDVEGALAFFRRNVSLYPEAPNVHDSLGEGLERAGRIDEAVVSYARAVERAKAVGDPRFDVFTRNRDRAAAAKAGPATLHPPDAAGLDLVEVSPSVVMSQRQSGSNSTCVRLADGLLFVDAGISTSAAKQFRAAMEKRFGLPVKALVLTHAHIDHVLAMGAFADVPVIAAEAGRPVYQRLAAVEWNEQRIAALAAVFPSFPQDVRDAKLAVPTTLFADEVVIGPAGSGVVVRRTGGHTADSSYAFFAPEGVLVAGDLVQAERRPYFGEPDTDLAAWTSALEGWHAMRLARVCPGHGPVVGPDYLPAIAKYFEALTAAVGTLKAEGLSVAEIAVHPSLPAGYWGGGDPLPRWWEACVARVVERL